MYRFADFNAGRYASRNAAFQNAVSVASSAALDLDGDLVVPGGDAPNRAAPKLRCGRSRPAWTSARPRSGAPSSGKAAPTSSGASSTSVSSRSPRPAGKRPLPRAVLPRIRLHSPKITRPLTTEWFARRVDERYKRCVARAR